MDDLHPLSVAAPTEPVAAVAAPTEPVAAAAAPTEPVAAAAAPTEPVAAAAAPTEPVAAAVAPTGIDLSAITDVDFMIPEDAFGIFENYRPENAEHIRTAIGLSRRLPVWSSENYQNKLFRSGTVPGVSLRVTRRMGRGTYGTAYEAVMSDGRPCVMKLVMLSPRSGHTLSSSKKDLHILQNIVAALNEIIIHKAIIETINADDEAVQKIADKKMAIVPNLYKFFMTQGYTTEPDAPNPLRKVMYIAIVMEKLDTTLWDFLDDYANNSRDVASTTAIAAVSFYQICNLLEFLGRTLRYNHRDLKINNVMVAHDDPSSATTTMCRVPHFHTFIIDFGMSRMNYLGHVFGGTSRLFYENEYNPTQDLLFLTWSYRRAVGCEVRSTVLCRAYSAHFERILKHLMDSSGIDFEHGDFEGRPTRDMYQTFGIAGDAVKIRRAGKYVSRKPVKANLITPHAVKIALKYLIRFLASSCSSGVDAAAYARVRIQLMDLFGAETGLRESDDVDIVGAVTIPL